MWKKFCIVFFVFTKLLLPIRYYIWIHHKYLGHIKTRLKMNVLQYNYNAETSLSIVCFPTVSNDLYLKPFVSYLK